jgi:predicted O-methyltransferase YrrM
MTISFHPPDKVIDSILTELKEAGQVHPEAVFNSNASGGLRREVTFRDMDFMWRLGRSKHHEQIVDAALECLKSHALIKDSDTYNKRSFAEFRRTVQEEFQGSWSSLTPVMERLIYMLTSVRRPKNLLELGSFWGYTLAFFAGPCIGVTPSFQAERIIGIDIDKANTELARENFSRLPNTDSIELIANNALKALPAIPGPFDFVYIEAKDEKTEGLYLDILKAVYDRLPEGAWIIAHDNNDWTFRSEMAQYLPYVRDTVNFSQSICFDVDNCGLELTIK